MNIEIRLNGESRTLAAPVSLADLVEQLGYAGKRMAVERNGAIVPKSVYPQTELADGDELEIVVAVGGG